MPFLSANTTNLSFIVFSGTPLWKRTAERQAVPAGGRADQLTKRKKASRRDGGFSAARTTKLGSLLLLKFIEYFYSRFYSIFGLNLFS
jgi:hypothetical protein